ncbi:MAG: prolyl oligopeptidase family serine peptidase [Candidatus Dormibacteraeota bacterium]|nr:prolyl oligopeptidase family serine peptidase [Candidatus Dormibacteraeota bacterium]
MVTAACAPSPSASTQTSQSRAVARTPGATPTVVPLPPYAIATLRTRPRPTGRISVGDAIGSGPGYAKYHVTWTSAGDTMTGVLDIPSGGGRFPVVLVNHGYAPVSQYYEGLDTAPYADPMASAGFLTISPSYPGYLGSGPGATNVPSIVGAAISDLDLISELPTLSQADPTRVAVAGHSNGGGVAEILMAADPGLRAAVLYAPVSSDMADNASKGWVHATSGTGGVPDPASDAAAYQLMSPRPWFDAGTPPALIMQGTADPEIPADWTAATVQALQADGAHVQFVSFAGATHIFGGADLTRANSLAIDWLKTWVG